MALKTQDELKELHGQQYADRFDKTQRPVRLERLVRKIRLNPHDKVADFACGNGMLMSLVAPKAHSYIGVDFSQPIIDIANAKKEALGITNASFECASIEEFCRSNQCAFNLGFALDFSEHVYDEEWLSILASIRSSLIGQGRLYLHTPNAKFMIEILKKHNFIFKQFPEHVAVRTMDENIALIEKSGFKISRVSLIPHYNVLRYLHPLSFAPLFGAYFKARIFIEAIKD